MSHKQQPVLQIPIKIGSGSALLLRRIAAGRFTMGSARGLPPALEAPEHVVDVPEFWIADAPVTGQQYHATMGRNPSQFKDAPDLPVENVNWLEASEFCSRLSKNAGRLFRLPSEAEWEYACRAGSTSAYHFGDSAVELSAYAWFENNSRGHTAPVRRKKPNSWGLYDMIGNVWEWCLDGWHEDYTGAPCDGTAWLNTTSRHRRYCVRGGAWDMDAFRRRSSYRSYDWEEIGTSRTGFRIASTDFSDK